MEDDLQEPGFDVEAASDDLAGSLFDAPPVQDQDDEFVEDEPIEASAEPVAEPIVERPAPKSWPTEMHAHWGKTPKEVQDYWETREKQMLDGLEQYKNESKSFQDAITPFMPRIQALGMKPADAVKALFNADNLLSTGSPQEKTNYLLHLAKQYGVDLGVQHTTQNDVVSQLQEKLHNIERTIQSGHEAQLQAEKERVTKQVEEFASDPAHPYFDEVAEDTIALIKSGYSLDDAYEKAVWANPVTRQKEMTRIQTESAESQKQKAIAEAQAAKKAKGINLNTRDTQRTPTEKKRATVRDLDSALRESMNEIKQTH